MDRISKHISYKEAIHSPTAIRKDIDNTPNALQITKMRAFGIYIFEPVRRHIGKPIKVHMFRTKKLNKAIGGSGYTRLGIYYATSQHCKGEAGDLDDILSDGTYNNADIFYYIAENLEFDQLIWEFGNGHSPNWVHCSYAGVHNNRNKISIAYKVKGKTKYKHFTNLNDFQLYKNTLYK